MKVGIDVLRGRRFRPLDGKRVALLSHQAALTADGATSAQLLRAALGPRLVALFGPEHGFFGQAVAGEKTASCRHPDWGIPVHSLYGEHRVPTTEMLAGVDAVVCDLQDLGVRCYTYLATLQNMLVACAASGVEVIVADRPIPLPLVVDGPLTEPGFMGFVAPCQVPLVHGMTPGECARWIVCRLRLDLPLTVVPMSGWHRADAAWDGARPAFLPPSPGIRTWESAQTYAATVFTEAIPEIDCGRETGAAFRVVGAPWLHAEALCERLRTRKFAGVAAFHPYRYVAASGNHKGQPCDGVRISVLNPQTFLPAALSLALLEALADMYETHTGGGDLWESPGVREAWFDNLYGSDAPRLALRFGSPLARELTRWRQSSHTFCASRADALIYD